MAIITRSMKGAELEHSELDNNFTELAADVDALTASVAAANNSITTQGTSITTLQTDLTTTQASAEIHPYYHFHGFAGAQLAGDSKFFDLAGINHGVRGDHLSDAQMFTTPGYVSTLDPVTSFTDSVIRIPAVNFDYASGEKLILYWLGKCTAEGTSARFMGDGVSPGWIILVPTSGAAQVMLNGAGYGRTTTALPFDGNLHSLGLILDGQTKKHCMWVDDEVDTFFPSGYETFSSGTVFDTKTTDTVNIGTASPKPGSTAGIATATRALVIMRLPAATTAPTVETLTTLFKQLRANPGKLILKSAF